jgi:hypothetical protein
LRLHLQEHRLNSVFYSRDAAGAAAPPAAATATGAVLKRRIFLQGLTILPFPELS